MAAVAVVVGSAELLTLRSEFASDGLLSAEITARFRATNARSRLARRLGPALVRPPVVAAAVVVRLLAGAALLAALAARARPSPWLLALILAATLVVHHAMVFGLNAADQMVLVVFAGATVAEAGLALDRDALVLGGLGFVAAQAGLAYFVAGVAKRAGPAWRAGDAVRAIVDTTAFGLAPVSDALHRSASAARAASFVVVAYEVAFPVVFLLPVEAAAAYLGVGLLLHLGIAAVMGLNLFLWAFAAAYPAILHVAWRW